MRYRRMYQPGGCYFFTVVTQGRHPLLVENIGRLRAAFREVRRRRPFAIDAIVVLPDHLHAIWRLPEGDADFSTRWMTIKRHFSAGVDVGAERVRAAGKREKGVWQRRFWEHLIRDERDWRAHMDYIHYNPVKHGYCAMPGEWPYSSFARMVGRGVYAADWRVVEPQVEVWEPLREP